MAKKRTTPPNQTRKAIDPPRIHDAESAVAGGSAVAPHPHSPVRHRGPSDENMGAPARVSPVNPNLGMSNGPQAGQRRGRRNGPPGNVPPAGKGPIGESNAERTAVTASATAQARGLRHNPPNTIAPTPRGSLVRPGTAPTVVSQYRADPRIQPQPYISDVDIDANWFSPFQPIYPFGPPYVTTPRLWDYPVGINLEINRRIGVCEVLRNMVTSGEGVLAPVIEARKDQLLRIPWEFQVRDKPDQADPRIQELDDFFQAPDSEHDFQTWLRMLLHDQFTIDAASVYCWKKKNGKPYRLDVLDGACYSDDTEVLTKRGWLRFAETTPDDEFATRNIGTKAFEWQRATYFHAVDYVGPMYHFHSRSLDILVSPNHRMLVNSLPRAMGGHSWREPGDGVIKAVDLAKHHSGRQSIPVTSKWIGTEISEKVFDLPKRPLRPWRMNTVQCVGAVEIACEICGNRFSVHPYRAKTARFCSPRCKSQRFVKRMAGDDYCAFMGMWLAEGSRQKGSAIISQQEKSRGYRPYRELIERITGRPPAFTLGRFTVSWKALVDWLEQFGHAADKFIPDDIMNATPRQLKVFWEYFRYGDGSGERDRLYTSSRRMADQLTEIAQKIGFSASVFVRRKTEAMAIGDRLIQPENCVENYVVSLRTTQYMHFNVETLPYAGKIRCVSVPNEFLFVRRNGKPAWCGNTLQVLVDDAGRIPDPPNPAFAQIIKGLPMVEFTRDEIIYAPRNPLPYAPIYGFGPVQQIALRMVSAIRKELYVFEQWTEGNVPDLILGAPEGYTPTQIADLQSLFDTLLSGDLAKRTRMRVIPGGIKPILAKGTTAEILAALDKFEERTARIICFAFSIPPTSFVSMMNRATSQQLQDEADSEGLYPLMQWARSLMNRIVAQWFGYPDIEFVWDIQADVDQAQQSQTLTRYVNAGIMTRNEARDSLSLPPDPDGDVLMVTTGATVTSLKYLVNAPPPQPKQVGGMPGANGQPPAIPTTATPVNGNGKPAQALPAPKKGDEAEDDEPAERKPAAKLVVPTTTEKKSLLRPSTDSNRDWLSY